MVAGISSVVVNNDANNITFTINSTQPQASYIFYAIEIQTIGQAGSGYTGFCESFGPAVGISSGENAVIDTYGTGGHALPAIMAVGWVVPRHRMPEGGTGSTFATIYRAAKPALGPDPRQAAFILMWCQRTPRMPINSSAGRLWGVRQHRLSSGVRWQLPALQRYGPL